MSDAPWHQLVTAYMFAGLAVGLFLVAVGACAGLGSGLTLAFLWR